MLNDFFEICGTEIPKGTAKEITIELPKLYNLPADIPVYVVRSRRNGPIVFVSAAIHGDELNGIEIIRRLRNSAIMKSLRGTLVLVPVVNVYGLSNQSRYLPDRRDLNRSFPGSTKGSLAARIAKLFFDEIAQKCDVGIDLHTGAIHRTNLPQVRINTKDEKSLMLAKAFEAPVILHSEIRDGSLRAAAQERDLPVILYEAGEALRFEETAIKVGLQGIINVLRSLNMLPKRRGRRVKEPLVFMQSSWVRATDSGMLRTLKKLGDAVENGDVIAMIDDPIQERSIALKAPFGGIIIGKSQIPLVQEGDAVFHIARSSDPSADEGTIGHIQEEAIEQLENSGSPIEPTIE